MQIFRLSTGRMKINQIPYVIFQAMRQFSFKFCITFQCRDTKFLWNFLAELLRFGQKEPIEIQILRLLHALMKVHSIWNHKAKVYSNSASLFSVVKGNSSVFFLAQTFILWTKISFQNGWVKIHQIPYVKFETTNQFFFKLCITLQCHER